MLEKMGWNEGAGLGAKGDGIKSHIKISKKNNALGTMLLQMSRTTLSR
jgi:Pin2-interacting protein X1